MVKLLVRISKRELEVLKMLQEGVRPSAAYQQLGLKSEKEIYVYISRVRTKIAKAQGFLSSVKPYRRILYPKRKGE
jgi:hypothetical protein